MLPFSQLDELIMTVLHSLQCKIGMASSNYPWQQFILSKGGNFGCNLKIIFGDVRWTRNLTSNTAAGTGWIGPLKGLASHQHSYRYTTWFAFLNQHLSKCWLFSTFTTCCFLKHLCLLGGILGFCLLACFSKEQVIWILMLYVTARPR